MSIRRHITNNRISSPDAQSLGRHCATLSRNRQYFEKQLDFG